MRDLAVQADATTSWSAQADRTPLVIVENTQGQGVKPAHQSAVLLRRCQACSG